MLMLAICVSYVCCNIFNEELLLNSKQIFLVVRVNFKYFKEIKFKENKKTSK